jgi:hypothetical protein
MAHADAREMLEAAAVEPDGIARLEAGDTPGSVALAGHLAGCASCVAELARLRATAELTRSALGVAPGGAPSVEVAPPPELRERTLALVRAYGRPRSPDAPAAATSVGVHGQPASVGAPADVRARRRRPAFGRTAVLIGLAATLVVGIGLGGLVATNQRQGQLDAQGATIEALTKVNQWTLRVASAPDATSVSLTSPTGGPGSGNVLYSPVTTELIAAMEGVAAPPPGREYRCWVHAGSTNAVLGKMYFGGDVGYWGGRSPAVASLPGGAVFGVTLVDVASGQPVGEPVLTGTL